MKTNAQPAEICIYYNILVYTFDESPRHCEEWRNVNDFWGGLAPHWKMKDLQEKNDKKRELAMCVVEGYAIRIETRSSSP